ncbi:MAG: hypothetical protein AB1473_14205 [Thermodesulfobacteriota bacterium]
MRLMFRLGCAVFLLCLIVGLSTASAYELTVSGTTVWSYLTYSQMGTNGFFGLYNRDAEHSLLVGGFGIPTGAFASMNGWVGRQVNNLVSGSNASQSSATALFFPFLRVNPAITLNGQYRIGSGLTEAAPGISNTYGVGEWTVWAVTIETPWGSVLYGKKPFAVGTGLQFDQANRSEESLVLTSDYGPVTVGVSFYPWRTDSISYYNISDKSGANGIDGAAWMAYTAAVVKTGLGIRYVKFFQGPESQRFQFFRERFAPQDTRISEGWIYFKYNTYRCFFATEVDFYYRTDRFQGSQAGTFINVPAFDGAGGGSLFAPQFVESWRWMVELGMVAGPTRVAFLYALTPGPDRRHGIFIDRQPAAMNQLDRTVFAFDPDRASISVFRPYSILLSTNYGAGVNAFGRSGTGYMADASVLAARLDYAVAANLNLYGSFLTARRVSHGYPWGYIRPQISGAATVATAVVEAGATGAVEYANRGTFVAPAPSIPDNDLGWEVNAGISWQLLESWLLNATVGYWQPGRWFNYACIDRSVPQWENPSQANSWGVNPDRFIDGVFGLDLSMTVDF